MKSRDMKPATRDISAELAAIDAMPEEDIDFSDAPEITDFSGFRRGVFYRPEKQAVTIRLDSDVVAWFKASEPKYQTAVNRVLREYMISHAKSA
ncbi:BrnA antitoxin family protein [soil metagenome]